MLIDRNKSEKEILLDHINESLLPTDSKISLSEVIFSYPTPIPKIGIKYVDKRNPNREYIPDTIVTVNPSDEFDYDTASDIEYRRVNLGLQYKLLNGKKRVALDKRYSEIDTIGIKNIFCDQCQLRNDSVDIKIIDTDNPLEKEIKIFPIDNSYLYTGVIHIHAIFRPEEHRARLSNLITDEPLLGFDYETIDN